MLQFNSVQENSCKSWYWLQSWYWFC